MRGRVAALEESVEVLETNTAAENEALASRLDAMALHASQLARDSCRFMLVGAPLVAVFTASGA